MPATYKSPVVSHAMQIKKYYAIFIEINTVVTQLGFNVPSPSRLNKLYFFVGVGSLLYLRFWWSNNIFLI